MSDWIRCPACGLNHTRRPDGCCPRCRRPDELEEAPAPEAPSTPPADPSQPSQAPATPPRRMDDRARSRARWALAAAVAVVAITWVLEGLLRATPPAGPVVATFPGGEVRLSEVEEEIRSLPPGLKHHDVAFIREVTQAVAARHALAAAARKRGLRAPLFAGRLAERALVRRLLEAEGMATPTSRGEAANHFRHYKTLFIQSGAAAVRLQNERQLAGIRYELDAPVEPPRPGQWEGEDRPFFLKTDELLGNSCAGVIHVAAGWYTGSCDARDGLLEALRPADLLYLEATYGPLEGFLHRMANDGRRRPIIQVSFSTSFTHEAMPPDQPLSFEREFKVRLLSVQGAGLAEADVRAAFQRVLGPFSACAAYYHWNNQSPEREGRLQLQLEAWEGTVIRAGIEPVGFTPAVYVPGTFRLQGFAVSDCYQPFLTYGIPGTGKAELVAEVKVEGGDPSR